MENQAFKLLHGAEISWWYQGRRQAVEQVLSLLSPSTHQVHPMSVLDVGAGFGGMCNLLSLYGEVYAMEPNEEARAIAGTRGYKKVFSSLEEIENAGLRFDLIGAFDVIEHAIDDREFIHRLRNILSFGGSMIATVPANPWLWSHHDVLHHHFRRYTKKSFRALLQENGFSLQYIGFWNMLLLPLAILVRMLGKSGEESMHPNSLMSRMFLKILRLENKMIPSFQLPWGVSLVILAKNDRGAV